MAGKILLHICCAPCTIYPLQTLKQEGYDICGLFYNPNIHPYLEYRKRLDTLEEYAGHMGLRIIREERYPLEDFFRQVAFREEERCRSCYHLRLSQAARTAQKARCDAFTTTLLYSRFQKHDLIRSIAENVARMQGIPFLYLDFRAGWSEGVRISKELGMYRQSYCGCVYSEKERFCALPRENFAGTEKEGKRNQGAANSDERPEIGCVSSNTVRGELRRLPSRKDVAIGEQQ